MNPKWVAFTGAFTSTGWLVAHFCHTGSTTAGAFIGFGVACVIGALR
jgi:hypothetical protein